MRVLKLTLLIVLGISLSVVAQNPSSNNFYSVNIYEGVDESFYSNSNFGVKNPIYGAFPVTSMIRHNRVDGLFLGYQEDRMSWNESNFLGIENVDIHGMVGYAIASDDIQYTLGAEKSIGYNSKWLLIGGQIHSTTATEDCWRTGQYENSISSFSSGFDFFDYYKADGYGLYTLFRPFERIEFGVSYNADQISSVQTNTDFSVISRYSTLRMNPAIDPQTDVINQQSITLGTTLNPNALTRSFLSTTVSAKVELANASSFKNDFTYNKWEVEAKSALRLDQSTSVEWRVMAGSITGEAPAYKNFALGGIGSLRGFGFKSLQGNQMLLSNLQLQFGKSNTTFHGWPDLSSTYLSFFLDSGTSNFNAANLTNKNPLTTYDITISEFSHNVGVGLGLGMLRFEVAKPIAGKHGQTAFWIRLNPTF